jgi:hypothetical protein
MFGLDGCLELAKRCYVLNVVRRPSYDFHDLLFRVPGSSETHRGWIGIARIELWVKPLQNVSAGKGSQLENASANERKVGDKRKSLLKAADFPIGVYEKPNQWGSHHGTESDKPENSHTLN